MTKIVSSDHEDDSSPRVVGQHLRRVRHRQGLSRAEVARSAGLTRREVAAYEKGRAVVPETDLWSIAGSCGVDLTEFMPERQTLRVSSDLSSLRLGDTHRQVGIPERPGGLPREYLAMLSELRNLAPGSRMPLQEPGLVALADALGGTPEAIETALVEQIGASNEEAARLRAMILRSSDREPSNRQPAMAGAPLDATTASFAPGGTPDAVEDFFSAPRAEDPFAPPPALELPGPIPMAAALAPSAPPVPQPVIPGVASTPAIPYHASAAEPLPGTPPIVWHAPGTPASRATAPPVAPAPHLTPVPSPAPGPHLTPAPAPQPMAAPQPVAPQPVAPQPVTAPQPAPTPSPRPEPGTPTAPVGTPDIVWTTASLSPTSVTTDVAASGRAPTRWALSDITVSGDMVVETVLDYAAGTGFGVLFRASIDDEGRVSGYSFDVDPDADGQFMVRQWADSRPHWRPIVKASVADPTHLFGRHTITVAMQGDRLAVFVDGAPVLQVPAMSRASVELGREPCRGDQLGVHAGVDTALAVESFRTGQPRVPTTR